MDITSPFTSGLGKGRAGEVKDFYASGPLMRIGESVRAELML